MKASKRRARMTERLAGAIVSWPAGSLIRVAKVTIPERHAKPLAEYRGRGLRLCMMTDRRERFAQPL